jgi:large subunit ribosomal protein L21
MYAVVHAGGLQHKVRVGQRILVEKLPGADTAGARVVLDRVLLIGEDDATLIGRPTVPGARVVATVADPDAKGPKLIVFKYKPKVRYRRKTGHRQHYTQLVVEEIITGRDGDAPVAAVASTDEPTDLAVATSEPEVAVVEAAVEAPTPAEAAAETVAPVEAATETATPMDAAPEPEVSSEASPDGDASDEATASIAAEAAAPAETAETSASDERAESTEKKES